MGKSAYRSFFSLFEVGQSRTTNLILAIFCSLLPQGASPSPWETLKIWRGYTWTTTSLQVFFSFFGWSVPYNQPDLHCFLPPFAAGAIPESLANLTKLEKMDLSYNNLSGRFFQFFRMVSPNWPSPFSTVSYAYPSKASGLRYVQVLTPACISSPSSQMPKQQKNPSSISCQIATSSFKIVKPAVKSLINTVR